MTDKGSEPAGHPLDELSVQLPGRLLTVEILLTLLLREKTSSRKLIVQAERILAHVEGEIIATTAPDRLAYPFEVFAAARAAMDKFAAEVRS